MPDRYTSLDRATPRAVVYVRVSTARQASEGVSLAAQETRCREHAGRLGYCVVLVCRDEGISGKDGLADRPGLAEAVEACRRETAALVVYSVSRVARRQRLLWELLDPDGPHRVRLSSATEPFDTATPMGRAMLGMIGVWSQLEADMVSQRTRDALAYARSHGTRLGRPSEPLPEPTLQRLAVLRHDAGLSWRAIAAQLEREGCRAPRGGTRHDPKALRRALERAVSEGRVETPRS